VEFRNDVVHRGKFPSREESLAFGDKCLTIIYDTLTAIRDSHLEAVMQVLGEHFQQKHAAAPKNAEIGILPRYNVINVQHLHSGEFARHDFRAYVEIARNRKRIVPLFGYNG
jgi:hypothetical protein